MEGTINMSLMISHNGSEWHGTFGVLLQTLLDDLLPEGPIFVQVTWEDDGVKEYTTRGEAVRITDDGKLYLRQVPMDSVIPLDQILSVEVQ